MNRTVRVKLGARSYDVRIGARVLESAVLKLGRREGYGRGTRRGRAILIADSKLKAHAGRALRAIERAGWDCVTVSVAATEVFKDLRSLYPIYGKMLDAGLDRKSFLFALGGGVIGDAAGFLAATYLRGIRWVGLPTTLLAQVDSSIGGKTAVNHPRGKNLIGAFHQPSLVVCETDFLSTLPVRERISGLGEVIKYGLIADAPFYSWLERHGARLTRSKGGPELAHAVAKSAELKARSVSRDELDALGVREALNFGHTIGHALEGATRYAVFRHGEAIIHGMRAATELSWLRGHLSDDENDRIQAFLAEIPVPPVPARVRTRELLPFIRRDKKAEAGKVRFVLLSRLGRTISDNAVVPRELEAVCDGLVRRKS